MLCTPPMNCGNSSNWVHWLYAWATGTCTSTDLVTVVILKPPDEFTWKIVHPVGYPDRASSNHAPIARSRPPPGSRFLRGRLPALAPGLLLLRGRAALARVAARARLLPPVVRRVGRVRDLGGPLLRHPFVLQGLVLLV